VSVLENCLVGLEAGGHAPPAGGDHSPCDRCGRSCVLAADFVAARAAGRRLYCPTCAKTILQAKPAAREGP
jgi:hypothetical protein